MIFPVYRTELELPQTESGHFSDSELRNFYSTSEVAGRIAVGSSVRSASVAYRLGEVSDNPPIERVYDILSDNIYVSKVELREKKGNQVPDYDELPFELKARGEFNGIDVSIAGLYYASNKHVGWMNISPRLALFKTISDEDQRKMLRL